MNCLNNMYSINIWFYEFRLAIYNANACNCFTSWMLYCPHPLHNQVFTSFFCSIGAHFVTEAMLSKVICVFQTSWLSISTSEWEDSGVVTVFPILFCRSQIDYVIIVCNEHSCDNTADDFVVVVFVVVWICSTRAGLLLTLQTHIHRQSTSTVKVSMLQHGAPWCKIVFK